MSEADTRKTKAQEDLKRKKLIFLSRKGHIQSHVFILVLFLPSLVILLAFFYVLFLHFSKVHDESEHLVERAVPTILSAQRNFININNLKNVITFIHTTNDQHESYTAYLNAENLLKEIKQESSYGKVNLRIIEAELSQLWRLRTRMEIVIAQYSSALNLMSRRAVEIGAGSNEISDVIMLALRGFFNSSVHLEGVDISKTLSKINRFNAEKCGMNDKPPALQEACAIFGDSISDFANTRTVYLDTLEEFNQSYEDLSVFLDDLIEIGSRFESAHLKNSLENISSNAGESESLIYSILLIVITIFCIAYILILRLVSRPLHGISSTIRDFMLKRVKPKFLPHSPVSEIEAIYNVLSMVFENVSEQDKKLESQYQNYKKLLNISFKDELTGVKNRRALDDLIEKLDVVPSDIAILMVDIDNFKAFNDTKGHQYGDFVLGTIGRQLRASVANEDCVYRYGGEEFLIILQEVADRVLADIGKRLCKVVYDLGIENSANPSGFLTISVGLSKSTEQDGQYSMTELISQADEALYYAKNSGRNKVVCYRDLERSLAKE